MKAVDEERRYAGLTARERRSARRTRLVDAAIEHFGTAGYRNTTIPELCRTAGVTARHFYEDFPTRELLLRAAYDRIAGEMIASVRTAMFAPPRRPQTSVRAAVEAYFTYVTADRRRARIFMLEMNGVEPALDRHRLATRDAFVAMCVENVRALGYDASAFDLRTLCLALVGASDSLTLTWLVSRPRPAVDDLVDHLTAIWIRVLQFDRRRR